MNRLTHIKPSMGRVVVEPASEETVTEHGIILLQGRQQLNGVQSSVGTVVEVCDAYRSALDDEDDSPSGPRYPVGTVVIFSKYNGTSITIERKTVIVMNESDILATLVEPPDP